MEMNSQETFNVLGSVAMRNSTSFSEQRMREARAVLNDVYRDLDWLKRGMSTDAQKYLEELEEEARHYSLQIKLYEMVIERKKRGN